jgi:hypothetical protein
MERSLSGLERTLGKRLYLKGYRGFESLSLRHRKSPSLMGLFLWRKLLEESA